MEKRKIEILQLQDYSTRKEMADGKFFSIFRIIFSNKQTLSVNKIYRQLLMFLDLLIVY